MAKAVLITGATGHQGGAVIDALLGEDADIEILALTRTTQSPSAQELSKKSPKIKLVGGNLNSPAGIFENAKKATKLDVWGVFSVQVPGAAEERQGKALVDEALKAGVKFFVYTSVDRGGEASFDTPTDIPHFISKYRIEHHLVEQAERSGSEMAWCILRPTAFSDNLVPGFFGRVFATSWRIALKGRPLQLVAVRDVGIIGAQALLRPNEFRARAVSLAGDELTFDQFATAFKDVTGQDIPTTYGFFCTLLMWLVKDFGTMFRWFHDHGYRANIPELRKMHPGLRDFRTWLAEDSKWASR